MGAHLYIVPKDGAGPKGANGQRRRYLHDDEGNDDMPSQIRPESNLCGSHH